MGEVAAARFSDPGSIPGASIYFNMKKAHVYGVSRRHGLSFFAFGYYLGAIRDIFHANRSLNFSAVSTL